MRIDPLLSPLREAQALVGVTPRFYFSDRVESPVTFGWLRPTVVLPRRIERMSESEQRAIACHELLHVVRRDWLVNLLEEFVLTLFWFHPAIRWLMRSIRLSREQVVDGRVVALTGARKAYLRALLDIAAAPQAGVAPAPLFLLESQLTRRVNSLVKEVRISKPRLIASLLIALAVVGVAGWWSVKTFWLVAPLGLPTETVVYAYGSAVLPGGSGASALVFYLVQDNGRNGFSSRVLGSAPIKGPVPISRPAPPYTPQARKDKVQGAIVAAVDVDASGNVAGVKLTVVSLSRDLRDGLDRSVIDAVCAWKFKPATQKGKPIPVRVHLQVNFSLS